MAQLVQAGQFVVDPGQTVAFFLKLETLFEDAVRQVLRELLGELLPRLAAALA